MARPRRLRMIDEMPNVTYFKPQGVPLRGLENVIISVSEFEALRLKDYENLEQIEASKRMDVSQPTFNRLYASVRKKIATAIVNGLAIKIEGGNYKMANRDGTGPQGKGPRTGRGLGNCKPKTDEKSEERKENLGLGQRPRRGQGLGRGRNS